MNWLTSKLDQVETVVATVFGIVVMVIAVKLIIERKLIGIFMFIISVGILSWFVFDPEGAASTFRSLVK